MAFSRWTKARLQIVAVVAAIGTAVGIAISWLLSEIIGFPYDFAQFEQGARNGLTVAGTLSALDLFYVQGSRGAWLRRLSVAPHTHPVDEVITVISGTFALGMGETADQRKAQPLPAGSFFALPPGMAHYVFIDEETVVQISTVGPWGLTYINPKDDPRQKTQ
jgi:mannose-6-phosphate isomerase-like protein (cupin superfamily)